MKKRIFWAVLLIALLTTTTHAQQETGISQRYGFETAIAKLTKKIVNQDLEIVTQETVYIDNYGQREARFIEEKRTIGKNDPTTKKKQIILEDDWLTTIDLESKKGTRVKNQSGNDLSSISQEEMMQLNHLAKGKEEVLGIREIVGKRCKLGQIKSEIDGVQSTTKFCIYKGWVLSSTSQIMNTKTDIEVVEFKENAKLPEGVFEVEEGAKINSYGKY